MSLTAYGAKASYTNHAHQVYRWLSTAYFRRFYADASFRARFVASLSSYCRQTAVIPQGSLLSLLLIALYMRKSPFYDFSHPRCTLGYLKESLIITAANCYKQWAVSIYGRKSKVILISRCITLPLSLILSVMIPRYS
ncbi:hypothetical protein Zmor_004113 [Zophobas morio]|uniref:Uncharacterized protein n=1 Tax=Zophobas morio TaxID=2755281 RepID=A0AA38LZS1_9CUCU|nr:hypothetical protein Zmor_004113 [Zophobas morio]